MGSLLLNLTMYGSLLILCRILNSVCQPPSVGRPNLLQLFENSTFTYFHYYDCGKGSFPSSYCGRNSSSRKTDSIRNHSHTYFDKRNNLFQNIVSEIRLGFSGKYCVHLILDRRQSSKWTLHPISAFRFRFSQEPVHLTDDPVSLYSTRNNNEPIVPTSIWLMAGWRTKYLDKFLTQLTIPGVTFFKIWKGFKGMFLYCHTCRNESRPLWIRIEPPSVRVQKEHLHWHSLNDIRRF